MLSDDIPITDCHHHLWAPNTHSWLPAVKETGHPAGPFKSVQDYLLPEYLADIEPYTITKSVYLQCHFDGYPPDETKWVQAMADSNPKGFPHGIVSFCDFSAPDTAQILSAHLKYPNLRGIRQLIDYHPINICHASHDKYLTDPNWLEGYSLLSTHNLTYDMHVLPHQYTRAYDVIKANPTVPVVVDHCGVMFERDEATMKLWRDGMAMFASLPNCSMKLSGLKMVRIESDKEFKTIIQELIALFGVNRCMFASNFPVDKVNTTFKQLMESTNFAIADYTLEEKRAIMANNANKFYRL